MAAIHFVNLSPQIKSAIVNGQYTREEILRLNERIKTDEKKKKKVFNIAMPLITLFLLVSGIIIYGSQIGFPEALPLLLLNLLAAAIVAPISWYASIGRMAKQYDDLMSVYYPDIYMDNKYGKAGQSTEEPDKPEPVTKPKTKIDKKSALKKAYFIITIILSVLVIVLFVIVGLSAVTSRRSSGDTAGATAAILIAGIAAGSLMLSVKGMCQNSYIPGIILEKAGILFIGAGLIVFVTGLFSQGKMLEAAAISVPAFIIGAVCFIIGTKMINKKRDQQ